MLQALRNNYNFDFIIESNNIIGISILDTIEISTNFCNNDVNFISYFVSKKLIFYIYLF